jgi:predicted nucleotidyltransferase component of viral defense system
LAFREVYHKQVGLLIRILPFIAQQDCFALKGGTAINLFVRNMPRLSVDVDLTYMPVLPRAESLAAIDAAMKRIAERIRKGLRRAAVIEGTIQPEKAVTKLLIRVGGVQTKIEVAPVLRGCVYKPELLTVSGSVEETFGFAEVRVVSFADLYGGKIVAALDRQHPRDLFDVRDLLANEGIDETLRRAFLVYLLSHNRPMFEVLAPRRKPIEAEFRRGFQGMTAEPVSMEDLTRARESLIETVVGKMPEQHRQFLLSFERGKPEWSLLELPGASDLPAIRWRRENLDKLRSAERAQLVSKLETVLTPSKRK